MAATKARTSFTLDRDLFERADRFSKSLHLSRSEFFERAVEDLVQTLEQEELRARIDAAQAALDEEADAEGRAVTEFLQRATAQSLHRAPGSDAW
jgi:metal-responsive CopG/Arc/MetJ family transcriptional regulator